jgi:hypothetical protein
MVGHKLPIQEPHESPFCKVYTPLRRSVSTIFEKGRVGLLKKGQVHLNRRSKKHRAKLKLKQ